MKRITSILVTLAMMVSMLPATVFAVDKPTFTDVTGNEYYATAAEALAELKILDGYEDGSFGATKDITRAEMAAIICRMLDKEDDADKAKGKTDFDDVSSSHWASGYINYASQNGIINGDGDGKFRPEDNVKHEEAVKMVVCAFGLGEGVKVDPNDWSAEYLSIAKGKGITADVKGSKGKASPRGDVAVMVYDGLTMNLAAPTASKAAGSYNGTQSVELSTTAKNATIYYTTDGTVPTVNSTKYTKAVSISKTSTLKAISVIGGVLLSDVITLEYTIKSSGGGGGGGSSRHNNSTPTPTASTQPLAYTRGEWVKILGDKLGFDTNIDKDDINFFYADTADSEYGIAIEIAEAYGILPTATSEGFEDSEQDIPYFYPDNAATREFVAYTVAEAMGFSGDYSIDCTDIADTLYPNQVSVVVGQGFMKLSDSKFYPKENLITSEKDAIFDKIDEFNNSTIVDVSDAHEKVEMAEGVIKDNLANITNYTVSVNDDNIIATVPKVAETEKLSEGNIIVLPPNDEYISGIALKIVAISENEDNITISAVEPDISEVINSIDYAGIAIGNANNFKPAEDVEVEYNPTGSIEDAEEIYPLNINAGGSVSVPGSLKFTLASKKISENVQASGTVSIEIPDITAKVNANLGWGVDLNELVLSMKEKIKFTGQISYTLAESGYELTNSNGNTRWEAGQVELGRLPIALGSTGLSIDIVFFYTVNAKGTASISYTMVATQGIQVRNGSFRTIKDFTQSLDAITLQGSFKAGLGMGVVLDAFGLMDLIGVDAHSGLGIDASFTAHIISTGNLYCGDGTVYLYGTLELDPETAFGKFIKNVMHASWSWDFFTSSNSPLKLKLHIENGHRVSACTYGVGGINGYVKDSDTGSIIPNARIMIYSGDAVVKTIYTDSTGNFKATNIAASNYKLKISATGYNTYNENITVEKNAVTYLEPLMMVDRSYNGQTGTVTGDVMDAVTGAMIPEVAYSVRKNWNTTYGDTIQTGTTDNSGEFSFDIPIGNYTIQFVKDQYTSTSTNITVRSNATNTSHVAMSPEGSVDFKDGVRIILTWQNEPSDLDSHLYGPTVDGTFDFHTCFFNQNYESNGSTIANLDRDDTDYYGPETTTINKLNSSGIYSFYVHDFSNGGSSSSSVLSNSGAKVTVYNGNTIMAVYNVPLNQNGTLWHVFDYNASTGELQSSNEFTYSDTPSDSRPSASTFATMSILEETGINLDTGLLGELIDNFDIANASMADLKKVEYARRVLNNPTSQLMVDSAIEVLKNMK